MVLGDFYYKEMTVEEIIDKVFREIKKEEAVSNDEEIDKFVAKHSNTPIPFD